MQGSNRVGIFVANEEATTEITMNVVRKEGDKWYVFTHDGKKKLSKGYDTKEEADKRLGEIEYFKHAKKNQLVTMKTAVSPTVRNDRMEDRDWLVVPMVMLVEGVHNGSCGALYYPKEELEKTPVSWNHKPVVVYHPDGPTACDPDVLTNRKVGVIMNTRFEEGKLKAEAWLDPERIKKVDNRIAEAIENKTMMELSTGLFTDMDGPDGDWGNEHYDAIARNYRPDHLALLPDMKGACSMEDGAGFLRLNAEGDKEEVLLIIDNAVDTTDQYIRIRQKVPALFEDGTFRTIWISKDKAIKAVVGKLKNPPKGSEGSMVIQSYLFVKKDWKSEDANKWVSDHKGKENAEEIRNELSHGTIWRQLNDAVWKINSQAFLEEVFDTFFIYIVGNDYSKQNYTVKDDKVTITGSAEPVVRVVSYKSKNWTIEVNSDKESKMTKEELVKKLMENKDSGWTEKDKDILNAMDEKMLSAIAEKVDNRAAAVAEAKKAEEAKNAAAAEAKKAEEAKKNAEQTAATTTNAEQKPMTEQEYIAAAPKNIQNVLTRGLRAYNSEKERLIGIIKANKGNPFKDDYLQSRELEELQGLAKLAAPAMKPEEDTSILMADYSGQAETATTNVDVELLPLAVMTFDEKK